MALAMWGEVRPDTGEDAEINTVLMGVGFTFTNRYTMRGRIGDFGSASDSLGRVVIRASDIWNSDGSMLDDARKGLDRILGGSSTSGDCDGLLESINIAAGIMAQTVGFSYGQYTALPPVFNPVGASYYFRSSGGQPDGPYLYTTYATKTLQWTGWSRSGRNRRKSMFFFGIAPGAAYDPEPSPWLPVGL
jgi:hypothetical protein